MLNYSQQYNICFSMYLTYSTKTINKIHNVYHGDDKLQQYSEFWPMSKYHSYTQNKFSITIMYIIYMYNPSSIFDVIKYLQSIEFKEVELFYNDILNYEHNISKDIQYITSTYGKPTQQNILQSYVNKKIKFYTCWWCLKYMGYLDQTLKSNIYSGMMYKIQFLLLYIKFKESSLEKIKTLLIQSDILQ